MTLRDVIESMGDDEAWIMAESALGAAMTGVAQGMVERDGWATVRYTDGSQVRFKHPPWWLDREPESIGGCHFASARHHWESLPESAQVAIA